MNQDYQQINASASPEVQMNENFDSINHVFVYSKRHPVTTGLFWGYYGGRWGGFEIDADILTLTDDDVNYIVVEIATGIISVSNASTNWDDTTDYVRVYKVTTADGLVDDVEDHRAGPGGIFGGGGATGSSSSARNIHIFLNRAPTSSERLCLVTFDVDTLFGATLADSGGITRTTATAQTDLDIKKNGSSVGTIRWAIAATTPTFIFASDVTFVANTDVLEVFAPGSADATFGNFSVRLTGTTT